MNLESVKFNLEELFCCIFDCVLNNYQGGPLWQSYKVAIDKVVTINLEYKVLMVCLPSSLANGMYKVTRLITKLKVQFV